MRPSLHLHTLIHRASELRALSRQKQNFERSAGNFISRPSTITALQSVLSIPRYDGIIIAFHIFIHAIHRASGPLRNFDWTRRSSGKKPCYGLADGGVRLSVLRWGPLRRLHFPDGRLAVPSSSGIDQEALFARAAAITSDDDFVGIPVIPCLMFSWLRFATAEASSIIVPPATPSWRFVISEGDWNARAEYQSSQEKEIEWSRRSDQRLKTSGFPCLCNLVNYCIRCLIQPGHWWDFHFIFWQICIIIIIQFVSIRSTRG